MKCRCIITYWCHHCQAHYTLFAPVSYTHLDVYKRQHIPLCTNEGVDFYVLEDLLFPKPGECWYMNFELKHRLSNNGITDRIHLVIDCIVNDWVRELFESAAVTDCKKIPKPALFSEEEELRIIEQLQQQGSPTALQIASDMKAILHNRKSHG